MKIKMSKTLNEKRVSGDSSHSILGTLKVVGKKDKQLKTPENALKCVYPKCNERIFKNQLCKYHYFQEMNLE